MSEPEPQPTVPPPRPRFQFSLRTLLLLFVVLGSSLGVFGVWGVLVFGLVVGLAVYIHHAESFSRLMQFVLLLLCLIGLVALLTPSVETHREAPPRVQCLNNLKQIALALICYEQANGCFPPAYVADKNGKPMHSWRVLILPYMDEGPLYKTYNFNEPWDGPNNKKLLASRPMVYACPSDPGAYGPGAAQTNYVAVVGANAAWAGEKSRKIGPVDFSGGLSKTAMVVEAANSGIAWTEPRDLSLDALGISGDKSPALTVSSHHGRREDFFFKYDRNSGANVAMGDGAVYSLPPGGLSIENLRKILKVGGCRWGDPRFEADLQYEEHRRPNWPNIAALAVWLLSVGTLLTQAVRSRKVRSAPRALPTG